MMAKVQADALKNCSVDLNEELGESDLLEDLRG